MEDKRGGIKAKSARFYVGFYAFRDNFYASVTILT